LTFAEVDCNWSWRKLELPFTEVGGAVVGVSAPDVIFAGRLGNYRYYDMDDTIAAALDLFEKLRARR
jgi:hypothetical protein